MRFSKYHGLGNDFIIVDQRDGVSAPLSSDDHQHVRALCDRNFGVGADGVLPILPPVSAGAIARMRVLNADGSEAQMCGNGLRCVVKYLCDRDSSIGPSGVIIDTGAGPLRCDARAHAGAIDTVTVDMGRPRLLRGEIPMTGRADERCVGTELIVAERTLAVTAVSMGNPHAIAFVDERGAALRALAEAIGPRIETHAWFPERTNVEFAAMRTRTEMDLLVWERGCGITLACGTGACATAVAACLTGRAELAKDITVHLLGGDLTVRVAPDYATVYMTGPARQVFDAEIDLNDALAAARPRVE